MPNPESKTAQTGAAPAGEQKQPKPAPTPSVGGDNDYQPPTVTKVEVPMEVVSVKASDRTIVAGLIMQGCVQRLSIGDCNRAKNLTPQVVELTDKLLAELGK